MRAAANGASLDLLGQKLQGDFVLQQTRTLEGDTVELEIANFNASFAGGLVTAVMPPKAEPTDPDPVASIAFTPAGVTADISVLVTADVDDVLLTGVFTLQIDTTNAETQYIRISGDGVGLLIGAQSLAGDFAIEVVVSQGRAVVYIAADNVELNFAQGDGQSLLAVTGGNGAIIISDTGRRPCRRGRLLRAG